MDEVVATLQTARYPSPPARTSSSLRLHQRFLSLPPRQTSHNNRSRKNRKAAALLHLIGTRGKRNRSRRSSRSVWLGLQSRRSTILRCRFSAQLRLAHAFAENEQHSKAWSRSTALFDLFFIETKILTARRNAHETKPKAV